MRNKIDKDNISNQNIYPYYIKKLDNYMLLKSSFGKNNFIY